MRLVVKLLDRVNYCDEVGDLRALRMLARGAHSERLFRPTTVGLVCAALADAGGRCSSYALNAAG